MGRWLAALRGFPYGALPPLSGFVEMDKIFFQNDFHVFTEALSEKTDLNLCRELREIHVIFQ